jgi:hypothetical protein
MLLWFLGELRNDRFGDLVSRLEKLIALQVSASEVS